MLWGGIGAGKTTLLRVLFPSPLDVERGDAGQGFAGGPLSREEGPQGGKPAIKTQMVEYEGVAIDTPGEYSEMGRLRRHLQSMAVEAQLLLVVQDATRAGSFLPPNYFRMFRQPVLGVVTKVDAPSARPEEAIATLRHIGVTGEVHCVSSYTGEGIASLRKALDERREQWQTQAVVRRSE